MSSFVPLLLLFVHPTTIVTIFTCLVTVFIEVQPAAAQETSIACSDAASSAQCTDFLRSFNCYDDMAAQCRALNTTTCSPQLSGMLLKDICCASCASCGDFHTKCEQDYVIPFGCGEDLYNICLHVMGGGGSGECDKLRNRLVKLDCCQSCRLVEEADTATLMRHECMAHRTMLQKSDPDYKAAVMYLGLAGCGITNENALTKLETVSQPCKESFCTAWFKSYVPACSCFGSQKELATKLFPLCGYVPGQPISVRAGAAAATYNLGGPEKCANFSFVSGRVDHYAGNALGANPTVDAVESYIFNLKLTLADMFGMEGYSRFFQIGSFNASFGYRMVIGIGSRDFLQKWVVDPHLAKLSWASVSFYNLDPPPSLQAIMRINIMLSTVWERETRSGGWVANELGRRSVGQFLLCIEPNKPPLTTPEPLGSFQPGPNKT